MLNANLENDYRDASHKAFVSHGMPAPETDGPVADCGCVKCFRGREKAGMSLEENREICRLAFARGLMLLENPLCR